MLKHKIYQILKMFFDKTLIFSLTSVIITSHKIYRSFLPIL